MSELANLPPMLTPKQYAAITGQNEQGIRYRCQIGSLPAIKDGKRWYISRDLVLGKLIEMEEQCA